MDFTLEGAKMPSKLTFKPKAIGKPKLVCRLVLTKIFVKIGFELMTSSWQLHDHFLKNDVIFAMTPPTV